MAAEGPAGGPPVVGWREWLALPDLGLGALHVKVDTGANTSALHALGVERYQEGGAPWVRFRTEPLLPERHASVLCVAAVCDERFVRSSNGHGENRLVIRTPLRLGLRVGAPTWEVELTLADRSAMRYPMLLGRQAMAGRLTIDPGAEYRLGTLGDAGAFYG